MLYSPDWRFHADTQLYWWKKEKKKLKFWMKHPQGFWLHYLLPVLGTTLSWLWLQTIYSFIKSIFNLIITLCFMSIPVFMFAFDLFLCFMIPTVFLSVFRLCFLSVFCVLFPVLFCSFCSLCVFHLDFLSLSCFPPLWLAAPICSTCVQLPLPSLCI